jgi:hypothetical protein
MKRRPLLLIQLIALPFFVVGFIVALPVAAFCHGFMLTWYVIED